MSHLKQQPPCVHILLWTSRFLCLQEGCRLYLAVFRRLPRNGSSHCRIACVPMTYETRYLGRRPLCFLNLSCMLPVSLVPLPSCLSSGDHLLLCHSLNFLIGKRRENPFIRGGERGSPGPSPNRPPRISINFLVVFPSSAVGLLLWLLNMLCFIPPETFNGVYLVQSLFPSFEKK